jgi:hypothetical protein
LFNDIVEISERVSCISLYAFHIVDSRLDWRLTISFCLFWRYSSHRSNPCFFTDKGWDGWLKTTKTWFVSNESHEMMQ